MTTAQIAIAAQYEGRAASLAAPAAEKDQGCTRSHPHEEMDDECQRKTVQAIANNFAAQNPSAYVASGKPESAGASVQGEAVPALRGSHIKGNHMHDAGAIARCSYCGRYSDDPASLHKEEYFCDCGKAYGWCGSFVKPDANSKWHGIQPAAPSNEVAASLEAKENVIQQAQIWAQEARTQRAIVTSLLKRLDLPPNDWEAESLIVGYVDFLKADAARYRWLRELWDTQHGEVNLDTLLQLDDPGALDATIDAAMAAYSGMDAGQDRKPHEKNGVVESPLLKQEPVAWMDEWGNPFPLGAHSTSGKLSWIDAHKRGWKPLYAHPKGQE